MAAPGPLRVVPGEASESDSEPELLVGVAGGVPGAGLKVPGEASETEEEEEEEKEEEERGGQRPKLPPVTAEEPAAIWGGGQGGPSLLQQRLWEGSGRLRGAVGSTLRQSYGTAARHLGGLGGGPGSGAGNCRRRCSLPAPGSPRPACRGRHRRYRHRLPPPARDPRGAAGALTGTGGLTEPPVPPASGTAVSTGSSIAG